jgi:hypothetical protein
MKIFFVAFFVSICCSLYAQRSMSVGFQITAGKKTKEYGVGNGISAK